MLNDIGWIVAFQTEDTTCAKVWRWDLDVEATLINPRWLWLRCRVSIGDRLPVCRQWRVGA